MPWACPAAAHRCNPQRSRRARGPCRRSLAGARAAGAPGGGHSGRGRRGTRGGGRAGAAVRRARGGGRAAAAGGGGPGPGRASRRAGARCVRAPGGGGLVPAAGGDARGAAPTEPGPSCRRRRCAGPSLAPPAPRPRARGPPGPCRWSRAPAAAAPRRPGPRGWAPLVPKSARGEGRKAMDSRGGGGAAGQRRFRGHLECPGDAIMEERTNGWGDSKREGRAGGSSAAQSAAAGRTGRGWGQLEAVHLGDCGGEGPPQRRTRVGQTRSEGPPGRSAGPAERTWGVDWG